MLKKIKSIMSLGVKASIVYTIASLFSKGLAIITVPIFTRLMPTDQIGVVNLYSSWFSMISAVSTLSLTSGGYAVAMREYADKRNQYMSSVLSLTTMMSLIIAVVYFICPEKWNEILGMSSPLCVLMLIGLLVSPATEFWLARQRYEYRYKTAGIVIIFSALLASVLAVLAVLWASSIGLQKLGEIRLGVSNAVTYGVAFVLWIFIFCKGKTFFNKDYWSFSLKLSIPLIGNSIASQILSVSDRTMISSMVGNDAVGIYGTLYTVSSLSLIVWGAINTSFVPFLFENIDNDRNKDKIKNVALKLMMAYGIIAIGMTLIAPEIIRILATDEYYEAIYIMPPIAAGVFMTSISNLYSNVLIYHKKTQYVMVSSIIAAIINLILNYAGIKMFGYMAAAYTTLVAYIVMAYIQSIVSRKIHRNIKGDNTASVYNDAGMLKITLFVIVVCIACLALYSNAIVRYCVIVLGILSVYIFRKSIIKIFIYKQI